MDTVTYPDTAVSRFVTEAFVPFKVKVRESPELVKRYLVSWTPTFRITDADGVSHYRVEGYFIPDDFIGRMALGLGGYRFDGNAFDQALAAWEEAGRHGGEEIKAEALYYLAAARYKKTKDAAKLHEGWRELIQKFPISEWARRANVPGKA